MTPLSNRWDIGKRRNEGELIAELVAMANLGRKERASITREATTLVSRIRSEARPGLMEVFLAEYGLSSNEGVALMCLAEALLRVPDAETIDALIEDKIASSNWSTHLGHSSSPLVNASTWGLFLTGRVLDDAEPGVVGTLHGLVRRLGEPVIRTAVGRAMREMGRQFVLGENIRSAMDRARGKENQGFTYSYDMLGEAAMTQADADKYARAYSNAIEEISKAATHGSVEKNPGISIKLSALHPRYEVAQAERVMAEIVPVVRSLARQAARAEIGLNVDAEEADRLNLSMHIIEQVLADPKLGPWEGFGVVVQAYGRRANTVIDSLYALADRHRRRLMVRLVKGAYWDTEIKHAQVEGLSDFPVFTAKPATDVSYIANARNLLSKTDRLYPQFATHNAHTVAAILHLAQRNSSSEFEFQRLHGMGEALHDMVLKDHRTRCRIYAPVGAHRDLLAYLVRRLLENGANSSFVNQIVDETIPPETVAACPFDALGKAKSIAKSPELYAPERRNSGGFDLTDTTVLERISRDRIRPEPWDIAPIIAGNVSNETTEDTLNPTTSEKTGKVRLASPEDVETALAAAAMWDAPVSIRAEILNKTADLYEENAGAIFGILATEAGKTLADAVAELREAVDFLRYYAAQTQTKQGRPRGVFTCISPWNFPLAIFTGQIAAALATGNGVLAKPAETTPAIASLAVSLMHRAGVPISALQLLPGSGSEVGTALTSDSRIHGVVFTGSTATAKRIQRAMAKGTRPGTPLIAETGGLNAMIVDSTALPEQAVKDIVASAVQSAGQRCSALRCLYLQKDIAPAVVEMIKGAIDELEVGDPWLLSTDVGPVITKSAAADIEAYVSSKSSHIIHQKNVSKSGNFVTPTVLSVDGIKDMEREVFGPILHIATFAAGEINGVIDEINASGYGLTFGLHSRIDDRVELVAETIQAGNVYANRNQIGAVVGSQPFGGEGLSGTGPKAGGPNYLNRFLQTPAERYSTKSNSTADAEHVETLLFATTPKSQTPCAQSLPGPTGELNRFSFVARDPVLCLGPGRKACMEQVRAVEAQGGVATSVDAHVPPDVLIDLSGYSAVLWWGEENRANAYADALAQRTGPILPLITDMPDPAHVVFERHICVDTTAAGGNTELLSGRG